MRLTYTVVLLREQDGRYSALIPALSGCATWGDDVPHALRMAEEAAALYVESLAAHGQPIPADPDSFTVEVGDATAATVHHITIGLEEAAPVA